MPTTPYCLLRAALNGGAPASGGITAAYGDAVVLSLESTSGVTTVQYRILGYPPGWTVPAGWSTKDDGYTYYVNVSGGGNAPSFTLPAPSTWGDWILTAYINGDQKGLSNTTPTGIRIASPNGTYDTAPFATSEFWPATFAAAYVVGQQRNWRKLDTTAGGAVSVSSLLRIPFTHFTTTITTANKGPAGTYGTFRVSIGGAEGVVFSGAPTFKLEKSNNGIDWSTVINVGVVDLTVAGDIIYTGAAGGTGVIDIGGYFLRVTIAGDFIYTGAGALYVTHAVPGSDFP